MEANLRGPPVAVAQLGDRGIVKLSRFGGGPSSLSFENT